MAALTHNICTAMIHYSMLVCSVLLSAVKDIDNNMYYICFLLLLVYTLMGVGNRFLVLINIENDTSLKQIGYNNVDFPVFGQNRVAQNSKPEGRRTLKP